MISCGGNLFFTVCGPSLYTHWGSLVFAVPKFFRHHAASPEENPCRSGSPWCKVRRKSLLWLTRPPCVAWYLELQWELLLVVHILNADSHKLHLMGKADKCSILDAGTLPPCPPSSCDLEQSHLLWWSVFLNTLSSPTLSLTQFPYAAPPPQEPVKTLRSLINIRKDTLRLVK